MHLLLLSLASALLSVTAQSGAWGQCGGIGWAGSTSCVAGYGCVVINPYYSQCTPSSSSSSTSTGTPTSTSSGSTSNPTGTGKQIRAVQDPVYHFYLQSQGGVPVLGPEASSGYFNIGNTIALTGSPTLYLNLAPATGSQSYQALTLNSTAVTTDWGLEGDTIITTSPRQLNFLACTTSNSSIYNVYLQNGNGVPSGTTCTMITLHLPCLC